MSEGLGWCIWITGLPGSGKSTIARALNKKLLEKGVRAQILSTDSLREVITPAPKYTEEERDVVYGAIVYVAKLLTQNGVNVIIDATANRRRYRDRARAVLGRYAEVYLSCPLEICMEREGGRIDTLKAPRNIYEKAFRGESQTVPGIGVPYEEPINPELVVDTDRLKPDECVDEILTMIIGRFEAQAC